MDKEGLVLPEKGTVCYRKYVCILLSNDLTKTLNVRIIFDKPKGLYLAFDILTEL